MRTIWTTRCAACGMTATMPATSEEAGFGGCCFRCQADVRWERGHDGDRGSRARYRRAVEARGREWSREAARCRSVGSMRVTYRDSLRREHYVSMRRIADWYDRAARRARAILEGLQAGGDRNGIG